MIPMVSNASIGTAKIYHDNDLIESSKLTDFYYQIKGGVNSLHFSLDVQDIDIPFWIINLDYNVEFNLHDSDSIETYRLTSFEYLNIIDGKVIFKVNSNRSFNYE